MTLVIKAITYFKVNYNWFDGYLMLGDGTMKEQEKQTAKEAKQAEKRIAMETAWLAREQAIEKGQAAKEAKREAKRIEEEPARLASSLAKRKTNLTREQTIAGDQKKRKLNSKK